MTERGEDASFFFYGTLIDPDVRRFVLGLEPEACTESAAWLPGFAVRYAAGARYPMLVAMPGARAHGVVVGPLSERHGRILDRFEGKDYRRESRLVRLSDRRQVAAKVYLPTKQASASRRPWSYEAWRQRDKAHFLRAIGHFSAGY